MKKEDMLLFAYKRFEQAYNLGLNIGLSMMGTTLFELGNVEQAVKFWKEAADKGIDEACIQLGDYYRNNDNQKMAFDYYVKAGKLGSKRGRELAKECLGEQKFDDDAVHKFVQQYISNNLEKLYMVVVEGFPLHGRGMVLVKLNVESDGIDVHVPIYASFETAKSLGFEWSEEMDSYDADNQMIVMAGIHRKGADTTCFGGLIEL